MTNLTHWDFGDMDRTLKQMDAGDVRAREIVLEHARDWLVYLLATVANDRAAIHRLENPAPLPITAEQVSQANALIERYAPAATSTTDVQVALGLLGTWIQTNRQYPRPVTTRDAAFSYGPISPEELAGGALPVDALDRPRPALPAPDAPTNDAVLDLLESAAKALRDVTVFTKGGGSLMRELLADCDRIAKKCELAIWSATMARREGDLEVGAGGGAALPEPEPPVDVVAAVRRDSVGRYWLCRRNGDGAHGGLAGMWEYPGGKVEPGEQLREALVRELQEEFGVQRPLIGAVLDSIEYQGYRVTFFEVEMQDPNDLYKHSEVRWMTADEACRVEHLPSGTIFNARHLGAALPAEHAPPEIAELVGRLREQCKWTTDMPCANDPPNQRCVSCRAADALETLARGISSLRAPQSGPSEAELFYVIEWPQLRSGDSACWWDGTVTRPVDALQAREAFTANIKQAVRFNDRHSAETVLRLVNDVGLGVIGLIVSEHGWMVTPAPHRAPSLPDTFIERAIRTALAQPEYKLEGDTVVGLSGAEASFIRQKYAERNRGSGAETPPQPEIEK